MRFIRVLSCRVIFVSLILLRSCSMLSLGTLVELFLFIFIRSGFDVTFISCDNLPAER